jgi:hypothetical protein
MIHGAKLKEGQERYSEKEEEKKYRWKIHNIKVKKRENNNGYNQSLTVHPASPG